MSDHTIDLDDDWLDEQLLAGDTTLDPRWRRNSLNGMKVTDALMGIPKYGHALLVVPLDGYRTLNRHVQATGTTQRAFMRRAVGALLLAEGVPRDQLNDFLGP